MTTHMFEERVMKTLKRIGRSPRIRSGLWLLLLAIVLLARPVRNLAQQVIDLCGCASIPNLVAFKDSDPSTWPPGTSRTVVSFQNVINIPLPPDGVMRFKSFQFTTCGYNLQFGRNAANTPVTLLVAGDVQLSSCGYELMLFGDDGSNGTSGSAGFAGLGGPGGYRGGDGVVQAVNLLRIGGAGLGPGGGSGGDGTTVGAPSGATFFGAPELTPLVAGSGGGGGSNGTAINCAGGGGGGGGGGLLIVANGTLTINGLYIDAHGGAGGSAGFSNCSNAGAGGAGGAIRLVANHFAFGDSYASQIIASGGSGGGGSVGAPGRIRFESIDSSALSVAYSANPTALRVVGPGPVANAISPTVRITGVGGQPTPAVPQGGYGTIDVILPTPGNTAVDFSTSGVPSGTTVLVTVKPRIGAPAISQTVPLNACDDQLVCASTATFNLAAGAYTVEARATFVVQ